MFALTVANSQGPRRGELIWFDEFDENEIDTSKWYFEIGDGSNTPNGPVRTFKCHLYKITFHRFSGSNKYHDHRVTVVCGHKT